MPLHGTPFNTNANELTIGEMMDLVKLAEERRIKECQWSAKAYLKKCARLRGLSVEEYILTKDPRGSKLKHFPAGIQTQ